MSKPFAFLFKKLAPVDFAIAFKNEALQTRAFILSFSSNPVYVEAVIDAYKDQEFTDLITQYLSRVEDDGVNQEFVHKVEEHVKSIFGKNRSASVVRKNMVINSKKGEI